MTTPLPASIAARVAAAESAACTCARSQGLHSKTCAKYVPGHDLASPELAVRRLVEEWGSAGEPAPTPHAAAVTAGREAARAKLNGLFPGQVGLTVADELADAAMAPLLAEIQRQPDDVFSELRTISVNAPADAEELPNGFGEFSITPKWVDIQYRWCDPNLPNMGAFQAGRSHVEVTGPIVGGDFGGEVGTVTFRTWTDDKRPDWVKRLVVKHNPPGWPLADSPAIARQGADTTSKDTPVVEPLCRCGHRKDQHSATYNDPQCDVCPGDSERSWRHPYTPEEN